MRKLACAALSAGLAATLAQPALAAPIVNGNFESLSLAGWYSSGTTAIANGAAGYLPLQGAGSALIVAMSQAPVPPYSCATDIWNVNCALPLPFAASGAALPSYTNYSPSPGVAFAFFRGGFIGQDVSVAAGDKIAWSWQLGGEAAGGLIDRGRFYATNGAAQVTIDSNLNVLTYTFPSAGTWSVYFGLYQTEDPYLYSVLKLDGVSIQAVPEASVWALLLMGLVSLTSITAPAGMRPKR